MIATATLWLPATAAAQQPVAEPSPAAAEAALAEAEQALAPQPGPGPEPDATLALNALAAAVPALDRRERREARALLARPTDGAADELQNGYPAGAPVVSAASAHFCAFWVDSPEFVDAPDLTDSDGDGVPDYVEAMLEIAELSRTVEVAPGALGWAPPKPDDDGCGSDPSVRADVYLKQLGSAGLFGYEAPDAGQGTARSQFGYMVLDDDYAPQEYGSYADPLDPARVTFAHEFNHLLQQNYDSFQDVWMFESTATWAEEFVFGEVDDYVAFLPAFAGDPGSPITDVRGGRGLKVYGAAVWNHWLSGRYGVDAVRRAWEVSDLTDPADFAVGAYERAIDEGGGRSFSKEFARFAAATAEWRSGSGGFPDAAEYPEMRRKGSLRVGGHRSFALDHTAIRLLEVRAGGRGAIRLAVRAERGVRAGIALVARDGSPVGGSVTRKSRFLGAGGSAAVKLRSPKRYERITAVIVNADGRVRGFSGSDWDYRRDDQRFRVRLKG